ncbi:MAG: hypothetical protein M1836_003512 [Candelina mexicana]|nr:MAG: hypothetical protein M1836_003512 [Candelina mexicana]
MVLGRLTHYAFDAVLISAFLAGVKRSTGLTYFLPPLPFPLPPPSIKLFQNTQTNKPRLPPADHSPSLNSEKISESRELKKWIDNYLGMGEWVMDQSVAILGSTSWFERKR